ncbi:MAG: hypothetical protein KJO98_00955 [Rhodothermia bacterium]|nr:hypothetical protein [Rhodothermia bacterium]
MNNPSVDDLRDCLAAAGRAHHDYEQKVLKGVRDELWSGFYAAYVLGRFGDFLPASRLSQLLKEAPSNGDWSGAAAGYVVRVIEASE